MNDTDKINVDDSHDDDRHHFDAVMLEGLVPYECKDLMIFFLVVLLLLFRATCC